MYVCMYMYVYIVIYVCELCMCMGVCVCGGVCMDGVGVRDCRKILTRHVSSLSLERMI